MRRTPFLLTAFLFALLVVVAGPAAADASSSDLAADIELAEAANETPVETPEALDELTVEQLQREHKIRQCTPAEAQQCPPNCCIYINGVICTD